VPAGEGCLIADDVAVPPVAPRAGPDGANSYRENVAIVADMVEALTVAR